MEVLSISGVVIGAVQEVINGLALAYPEFRGQADRFYKLAKLQLLGDEAYRKFGGDTKTASYRGVWGDASDVRREIIDAAKDLNGQFSLIQIRQNDAHTSTFCTSGGTHVVMRTAYGLFTFEIHFNRDSENEARRVLVGLYASTERDSIILQIAGNLQDKIAADIARREMMRTKLRGWSEITA